MILLGGCDQVQDSESIPPTAINDINAIATAIVLFKKDYNRYPSSMEGLRA